MNFVTHFDSGFLYRGLAMARSLARTNPGSRLFVVCLDERTERLLGPLAPGNTILVPYRDFEDEGLRRVRPDRTVAEFCWTCTPATARWVLDHHREVDLVTYLDADLFFYADASPILAEIDDASVLVTEHRFRSDVERNIRDNGVYCVQFVSFRRDEAGRRALDWWYERCLEWCYARHEDGRYGDQKYLDDWPRRFDRVRVLAGIERCLAPWNLLSHRIAASGDRIRVDGRADLVFFHFQSLKIHGEGRYTLAIDSRLRREDVRLLYRPYLTALEAAISDVAAIDPTFDAGRSPIGAGESLRWLRVLKRRLLGKHHLVRYQDLLAGSGRAGS